MNSDDANRSMAEPNTGLGQTTFGGPKALTSDEWKAILARWIRKTLLFWEARETLSLILAFACIAAIIGLLWVTGRPTITILAQATLAAIASTALKPRQPPLM